MSCFYCIITWNGIHFHVATDEDNDETSAVLSSGRAYLFTVHRMTWLHHAAPRKLSVSSSRMWFRIFLGVPDKWMKKKGSRYFRWSERFVCRYGRKTSRPLGLFKTIVGVGDCDGHRMGCKNIASNSSVQDTESLTAIGLVDSSMIWLIFCCQNIA